MMIALCVAFWLQLDGAASAATCVGVLALPTRGQALAKAAYRLLGTAIGVAASLTIAGLFNGMREPFLMAVAGWIAGCVYVAGRLDGMRAYGAVLSGYTVAIVAAAAIDSPLDTFANGVNRGAAIVVGVLAVAFVNDILTAPDVLATLDRRLRATHDRVRAFVDGTVERGRADPIETAHVFREITGIHPDIAAMRVESVRGRARAAAARRACASMVEEVRDAISLASTFQIAGVGSGAWHRELIADFRSGEVRIEDVLDAGSADAADPTSPRVVAASGAHALLRHAAAVEEALRDVSTGRGDTRGPSLPLYRSSRAAARDALRVFLAILATSVLLVWAGWPASSFALVQVAALSALSCTSANPFGLAIGAVIGAPVAVATVGVVQFLVLDGVDDFPLLAIAMLPPVVLSCLMIGSGKPLLSGIGFVALVYLPILLNPSNPQSYDPQSYVVDSLLVLTAAACVFVLLGALLPTSDARRRRWIFASLRGDLDAATRGAKAGRATDAAAAYRAADRVGQLATLKFGSEAARTEALASALRISSLTFAVRASVDALSALGSAAGANARAAVRALDLVELRAESDALGASARADDAGEPARWAATTLKRTAALLESARDDLRASRTEGFR